MEVDYVMTERFETADRGLEYRVVVVADGGESLFPYTFKQSYGFYVNDMVDKALADLGLGHLTAQVTAHGGAYQVYRITK